MKRFKDPIYGYIALPTEFMDIIDSPCFQRLRHISQTSYTPLYASALHNRFIHSIGVYHLGKLAFNALKINTRKIDKQEIVTESMWNSYEETFLLACLLHDVGHAPFSHTGEHLYVDKQDPPTLYNLLIKHVDNEAFEHDLAHYHDVYKPAAPHEIMSVIVAIHEFRDEFSDSAKKDLFARCITGYHYQECDPNELNDVIKNSIITLLNSSFIDVDKLDYLIRDSYVTGFDTIQIDYQRLLTSITIKYNVEKSVYAMMFNKASLSILENVIYAHDSERKWIQNHPVVLYEGFLLKCAMQSLNTYYGEDIPLFQLKSLLDTGMCFNDGTKIRLLCDADIISMMKKMDDKFMNYYFNRSERHHPFWKSEAEFHAIFNKYFSDDMIESITKKFTDLMSFSSIVENIIDDNLFNFIQEEKEKCLLMKTKERAVAKKNLDNHEKCLKCLKEISVKLDIPFEFIIIKTEEFSSGFQKEHLGNAIIDFPSSNNQRELKHVLNTITFTSENHDFFYLYYKRNKPHQEIDINIVFDIIKSTF